MKISIFIFTLLALITAALSAPIPEPMKITAGTEAALTRRSATGSSSSHEDGHGSKGVTLQHILDNPGQYAEKLGNYLSEAKDADGKRRMGDRLMKDAAKKAKKIAKELKRLAKAIFKNKSAREKERKRIGQEAQEMAEETAKAEELEYVAEQRKASIALRLVAAAKKAKGKASGAFIKAFNKEEN